MNATTRLQKRTYALPADLLAQFECTVTTGRRSQAVTEAMRDWLETRRREQMRRDVIAGCQDMSDVYQEIAQEFHPLEEEVERRAAAAAASANHK